MLSAPSQAVTRLERNWPIEVCWVHQYPDSMYSSREPCLCPTLMDGRNEMQAGRDFVTALAVSRLVIRGFVPSQACPMYFTDQRISLTS